MREPEMSDFKMLDKAPYPQGVPDSKAVVDITMAGLKGIENLYGRVFTIRFIKHALQIITRKIVNSQQKIYLI